MQRGGRYEKQRGTRAALEIRKTKAAAEEISIDAAVAAAPTRLGGVFRFEIGAAKTALEAFLSGQVFALILTVSGRNYI